MRRLTRAVAVLKSLVSELQECAVSSRLGAGSIILMPAFTVLPSVRGVDRTGSSCSLKLEG